MNYSDTQNKEIGLTIVELLVVLTIVFVVSTIAIMQFGGSKKSLEMQNVAIEFKTYLERARFDSLKRNVSDPTEMAKVIVNDAKSFTSATDLNQNGILEVAERRNIDFSYQDGVKFQDANITFPIIITFNKRGHTLAIDGNGNTFKPKFVVCQKSCQDLARTPENFQVVSISPTGTVTIFNGDELQDTAETPKDIDTPTQGDVNPLSTTMHSDGSIPVIDLPDTNTK